ncbi:MAG: T9SS type A sorting domain-containing protein [Flavobacteriales bacterium]|nr:T9SS type A sorting domain-containing protein [Flavobacteriales bacterium]
MNKNILVLFFTFLLLGTFSLNAGGGIGIESSSSLYQSSKVTLYPNPAVDYTRVKSLNPALQIKEIQLIDIVGNPMSRITTQGSSLVEINVSSLKKGKYFVKVDFTNGEKEITQLVKQ